MAQRQREKLVENITCFAAKPGKEMLAASIRSKNPRKEIVNVCSLASVR